MSIIHTVLPASKVKRLGQRDNDYLKRKLDDNCALNELLNKPVNKPLLDELRCILDRKTITRRKTEQHQRNSKVTVYKNGRLIRIEHANGKVMKYV